MFKLSIKSKISEENSRFFKNVFSLGVLQAVNYILPLLTIPYVVRIIGVDSFGLISFSQATIAYLVLLTDYGFNLSATRNVSIHRDNYEKLSEIFSSVMAIKLFLLAISFVLLCFLVFVVEKFNANWEVYLITFTIVVGQAIFPVWMFQGLESMKYVTYLNLIAKAFFTACIFLFVNDKDDYILVPLLNGLGFIFAGLFSLALIKKITQLRLILPTKLSLVYYVKDGWHVFISSVSVSLYTVSMVFLLGIFFNNAVVGYYSAADKIIQASKGIVTPISQALFPLVSHKVEIDRAAGLRFIRKVAVVLISAMFIFSLLLYLFSEDVVGIMLGDEYKQSALLLKIMAFVPVAVAISNILGVQLMLNLGYKKAFSRIIIVSGVVGVVVSLILIPSYGAIGASISVLLVEALVAAFMAGYLLYNRKSVEYE